VYFGKFVYILEDICPCRHITNISFYMAKKGGPASPFEPLFQDAREALFFMLFIARPI
jgi:hypothetical protein